MQLSPKARDLILRFEGFDPHPEWPRFESGITIGYGWDIGHEPLSEFYRQWVDYLPGEEFYRLANCSGVKGIDARKLLPHVRDISIEREAAQNVFDRYTVPHYVALTLQTWPGSDLLPADAFGALVSVIYNRGTSLKGERRKEMRVIKSLVLDGDIAGIADQVEAMKRLWADVSRSDGDLHDRRVAEAALIRGCV